MTYDPAHSATAGSPREPPGRRKPPQPSPYDYQELLRWPRWKVALKRWLIRLRLARPARSWWRAWAEESFPTGRPTLAPPTPDGGLWRLNLGCGTSHYAGYLHADLAPYSHLDFQADARALPLRDGCLQELLCTELLEHLDEEGGRQLLAEAARVLAPGGRLILTTPDLNLLCQVWQAHVPTHCQMMQHLYGDLGDHQTLYTGEMVVRLCQEAGLLVRRVIPHWGPIWGHLLVLAEKPPAEDAHG